MYVQERQRTCSRSLVTSAATVQLILFQLRNLNCSNLPDFSLSLKNSYGGRHSKELLHYWLIRVVCCGLDQWEASATSSPLPHILKTDLAVMSASQLLPRCSQATALISSHLLTSDLMRSSMPIIPPLPHAPSLMAKTARCILLCSSSGSHDPLSIMWYQHLDEGVKMIAPARRYFTKTPKF